MEPIEFKYKKLKTAQDLSKTTLQKIGIRLAKENEDGFYVVPEDKEIINYINNLAKNNEIKHYRLNVEYTTIYLFDSNDIVKDFDVIEVEAKKTTELIKIQCCDEKVTHHDNVPYQISSINDLYKITKSTFNSGSCVYFLCRKGKIVYIGQAENVHNRIIEHNKNKEFDSVYYVRISANKMFKYERALISFFEPEYNEKIAKLDNQTKSLAESILNNYAVI